MGVTIKADVAEMHKERKLIRAAGNVKLLQEGDEANGEQISYDLDKGIGALVRAKGKTQNFQVRGKPTSGYIYFSGEEVLERTEEFSLFKGGFTTCDLPEGKEHYQLTTKNIIIEPGEKLVAKKVSLFYKGHKLFSWPVMVISLKQRKSQPYFPKFGYNKPEGFFVRSKYSYYLGSSQYGYFRFDYATKRGLGFGIDHDYRFSEKSWGKVYYFRQSTHSNVTNNEFRITHNQLLPGDFKITYNFNLTYNTGYYILAKPNISSDIAANKRGKSYNTNVSYRYFTDSGDTSRHSFDFTHSQTFFQSWRTSFKANLLSNKGKNFSSEQDKYSLEVQKSLGPFDMKILIDNSAGNFTQFLNKLPEFVFTCKQPIKLLGNAFPIKAIVTLGKYREEPSGINTTRTNFQLSCQNNFRIGKSGNINTSTSLDQSIYGSGEARYVIDHRSTWRQKFGSHINTQINYSCRFPNGYSPFRFDRVGTSKYQTINTEFAFFDKPNEGVWNVNLQTGYNITSHQFQNLATRFQFLPKKNWQMNFSTSYDLNNHRWQTFDTQLDIQLHPQWHVEYNGSYSFLSRRFANQSIRITKDCHCWFYSIIYRSQRKELLLQVAIKAFPFESFNLGVSPEGPILPLPQVFTNPNLEFGGERGE